MCDRRLRDEIEEHLAFVLSRSQATDDAAADGVSTLREGLARADLMLRDAVLFGHKRVRPLLCMAFHEAFATAVVTPRASRRACLDAAAAIELLHVFTLIHDDVVDHGETRAGHPALRVALQGCTGVQGTLGDTTGGQRLADALAIVQGDLLFTLAMSTLTSMPASSSVVLSAMNEFLTCARSTGRGQLADSLASVTGSSRTGARISPGALPGASVDACEHVSGAKTAAHTFRLPLGLGAYLGGASPAQRSILRHLSVPCGIAYQLANDLADLDGGGTGCLPWQDARCGRTTSLLATSLVGATKATRRDIMELYGTPDLDSEGEMLLRRMVLATGARDSVAARVLQLLVGVDNLAAMLPAAARDALLSWVSNPLRSAVALPAWQRHRRGTGDVNSARRSPHSAPLPLMG